MTTTIINPYSPAGFPQSYKVLQIVPRNTAENEANKKTITPVLHNDRALHVFPDMESKISWMQIIGIFLLVFLGTVVIRFFGSAYFSFGKPVTVKDVVLDKEWTYWINMSFIIWDRVLAFITSYNIGRWRIKVLFNNSLGPEARVSYGKGMFVLLTDHIITWLRYPILLVFVYSQIDFALAYAIPDVVLGIWSAHVSVTTMISVCDDKNKKNAAPTPVERVLPGGDELSKWTFKVAGAKFDVIMLFTICEYLQLVGYVFMFYSTGILQSNYFQFHPPFAVFGRVFKQKDKYAFIILFVFVDQLLASLLNVVVGPYISRSLLNSSPKFTDTRYGKNGARFIYISRKIFQWIRTMFVLNFTLSQFIFFFFIIIADTIVTIWLTDRALVQREIAYEMNHPDAPVSKRSKNALLEYAREIQLSPMKITVGVWIELIIVILVMIFQFDIHNRMPYFDFPPPITIFDVVVVDMGQIVILFVYVFIDRIIFTLTTEITYPYISNIISACDEHSPHTYSYHDLMFIMTINDVSNWIRRVVGFNFLLSNISLVIIEGGTDIAVSWIILERYLAYKKNVDADTYIKYVSQHQGERPLFPIVKEQRDPAYDPTIELKIRAVSAQSHLIEMSVDEIYGNKNIND